MKPILEIVSYEGDTAPVPERLTAILQRRTNAAGGSEVENSVREILKQVRARGDVAIAEFMARFDGVSLTPGRFRVPQKALDDAHKAMDAELEQALKEAAGNIERFHERQRTESWRIEDADGVTLGKRVLPLRRVGVCVPGGEAPLLSTLLMTVVPAKVAGVAQICVVTPPQKNGLPHPDLLATAALLGIDELYAIGGAQAVAALAYGTQTIPPVDKIVGPGGAYTVEAKRQVFGVVGIEMIPGPSEIVVLADDSADPQFIAADLLSQAEHGSGLEAAVCITTSPELAQQVVNAVATQKAELPRAEAIERALVSYGAVVVVADLTTGVDLVNRLAPEHVELHVHDPWSVHERVVNAGAVFLGEASTEPVGDYFAGTNHVLPTNGAARYASSLGLSDFVKTTSVVHYTPDKLRQTGHKIIRMARAEDLEAHARAVQIRLDKYGSNE